MRRPALPLLALALPLALLACGDDDDDGAPVPQPTVSPAPTPTPTATPSPTPTASAVTRTVVATLDQPWAIATLPDGRLLVTEKPGRLRLVTTAGVVSTVSGTPTVNPAGQGGLLDVAIDPQYAVFPYIYLSFAEPGTGGTGLAVARARLSANGATLTDLEVIWRQAPKIATDDRHFGGRIAFGPDNRLYVTAGERHQGAPAQDLTTTLGKIVRIERDGTIPADNPFTSIATARPEIWSLGHRNPYGLVFATDGRLFESEMGPDAGDEFNLIVGGANYGWRVVSEGSDGGQALPRHATDPRFVAPLVSWTPVISPAGMIQYTGTRFAGWNGDFVLAALSGQALVRVRLNGSTASEVARVPLGVRVRDIEQAADGSMLIVEDGDGGRLVRLTPS